MKFNALTPTLAASAVALLIAGCGGGGGDGATPPAPPAASLQVSGTAATGKALASADVQVKCAAGTGSATTQADGSYRITLEGGALPCMIRVTGTTADGVQVTYHSVTEAGSSDAATNQTSAVANVTPLTEIVLAQLTGTLPGAAFDGFSSASADQITTEKLTAATTAVVTSLKDATGLDFSSVDPFKASLTAATATTPVVDDPYDKLLDDLKTKVAPEALPQIVTQVATAAASGNGAGLQDAMASVEAGSLAGCPTAISGKYRIVEYFGASYVRNFNFKTMTVTRPDGSSAGAIVADATQACQFSITNKTDMVDVQLDFVMGANGIGAERIQNLAAGRQNIALLFPEQSHTPSELVGGWTFHQGGFLPGQGFVHTAGRFELAADGTVSLCDFEIGASTWTTCLPDTDIAMTAQARSDGGIALVSGSTTIASVWGYRAPSGSLTFFATTNEAGSTAGTVAQVTLELFKPATQQLPAVDTTTKYWDVTLTRLPNVGVGQNGTSLVADTITAIGVDSAASTVTRRRGSDGREDTVHYNAPLDGLRLREQSTIPGVYGFPLPGTGLVVSVNSSPTTTHLYNVSVARP